MTATSGALSSIRLADIVGELGGELHGDAERRVARIASLEHAGPADLSFVAQARLRPLLERSHAGVLVVREDLREAALARGAAVIVTADPYLYYARLTRCSPPGSDRRPCQACIPAP